MSHHGGSEDLVLVTGATGFVALHVIQQLQREGYRVRGTVRSLKNENRVKPLKLLCPEAKYPLELVEADLTGDEGWDAAARGCRYCMHVASPFPNTAPKKPDDILVPAVEGTKRVLQACANAGTVKRIVLTSSIAAVHGEFSNEEGRIYNEDDWTDLQSGDMDTYARSKTMAEKAAWDFVKSLPPEGGMELAVINPGYVFGPGIGGAVGTSLELIQRTMNFFAVPLIPRLYIPVCDVRDVALAHLRAMVLPGAANNRHLIVSGHMWYRDVGRTLKEEFGRYGYCVSTWSAPDFGVYLFGFVDKFAALAVHRLSKAYTFSNLRMRNVLNVEPRDAKEVLVDTVHALIQCGAIRRTRSYRPKP